MAAAKSGAAATGATTIKRIAKEEQMWAKLPEVASGRLSLYRTSPDSPLGVAARVYFPPTLPATAPCAGMPSPFFGYCVTVLFNVPEDYPFKPPRCEILWGGARRKPSDSELPPTFEILWRGARRKPSDSELPPIVDVMRAFVAGSHVRDTWCPGRGLASICTPLLRAMDGELLPMSPDAPPTVSLYALLAVPQHLRLCYAKAEAHEAPPSQAPSADAGGVVVEGGAAAATAAPQAAAPAQALVVPAAEAVGPAPQPSFTIFVQKVSGNTISLSVLSSDTLDSIKAKILRKEGIPLKNQRILFARRQLEPGPTLADYHVKEGDTLNFIWQMHSGPPDVEDVIEEWKFCGALASVPAQPEAFLAALAAAAAAFDAAPAAS